MLVKVSSDVRYWHKADIALMHCTCPPMTQSGHRTQLRALRLRAREHELHQIRRGARKMIPVICRNFM